jgi:hypothetical protein
VSDLSLLLAAVSLWAGQETVIEPPLTVTVLLGSGEGPDRR